MNLNGAKQFINKNIRQKLPRVFNLSPAVVQLFRGGNWTTSYSVVNFPAFFSPLTATSYKFRATLHNEFGAKVWSEEIVLPKYGSAEIIPKNRDSELQKISIGMIAVEILPPNLIFNADKHLGVIRPQIYAHYENNQSRALGVIHPQSALLKKEPQALDWRSNNIIDLNSVVSIEALQINPSPKDYNAKIQLIDVDSNRLLSEKEVHIPAMGSHKTVFEVGSQTGNVFIAASFLPGPNAKPIIFINRTNGTSSVTHA